MKNLLDALFGTESEERRIGLLAGGILVFITLVTGMLVFYIVAGQLDKELKRGIVRTLNDRERLLTSALEHRIEDARDAAALPHLAHLMKQAAITGVDDILRLEVQGVLISQRLTGVVLLDAQGQLLLSLGKFIAQPEVAVALRAPAGATLLWQGGYYLNIDAPIRKEGQLLGTLRMEMPLKELSAMTTDYRDLGESGEAVLCAALDRESMQCFPSRHRPQGFRSPRMSDNRALPLSIALDGQAGFIVASDYRGHEVFDAYKPIGHTGLGMVVKIDTVELERPIRHHLLTGAGVLALLVILGTALLRWQVGPVVREMAASRSRLKQAHDEMLASHAALLKTNQALMEADAKVREVQAENDRQMNALAEANVRMVLYHSTMEQIRHADSSFSGNGDMDAFYHSILRDVMSVTDSKYGAIGLFDENGELRQFLTEGISEEEREKIGPYPAGRGLLQAFYKEKSITRVDRIADDPRSCGFPPGHPPMNSLLGVPLLVNGITKGVIYLTEKMNGEPFTDQDEMLVEMVVHEVAHTLERSELMASLRDSNQALTQERAEQKLLIAKLQEAQNQLLQSEKMASIGQLAAGVAHEINNPIGYVNSNLGSLDNYIQSILGVVAAYEQAENAIIDSDALSRVQAAKQEADLEFLRQDVAALMTESREGITRVKKIVQDLKDFSHVDEAEWQWTDLHHGLDATLNIVWNELKYKAEVIKEYGNLPEIECFPSQLNQVFMNLLVNAGHAIEEHGTITIRTGAENEQVWVEIADSGKGIAPEHLTRIFEPFFTTKPVGKGTGLGLSVSYNIVQKHHGRIEVESEIGKGTTFRVWLPIKRADA